MDAQQTDRQSDLSFTPRGYCTHILIKQTKCLAKLVRALRRSLLNFVLQPPLDLVNGPAVLLDGSRQFRDCRIKRSLDLCRVEVVCEFLSRSSNLLFAKLALCIFTFPCLFGLALRLVSPVRH